MKWAEKCALFGIVCRFHNVKCPHGFHPGLHLVLGGPQQGNMPKTHLSPSFNIYVGITW